MKLWTVNQIQKKKFFWDSLSNIEEAIETLKEANRDLSNTAVDAKAASTENKFEDELLKEVWSNIHIETAI